MAALTTLLEENGSCTIVATLTTTVTRLTTLTRHARDGEGRTTAIAICRSSVTPKRGGETPATREKEARPTGTLARCRTIGLTFRRGVAVLPVLVQNEAVE